MTDDNGTDGQTDRQSATHNAAPSYGGGPHNNYNEGATGWTKELYDRFSRLDAIPCARRRHYSKHRAMQSVVRLINETLNISNKAFKTIYWRLNSRMVMSLSQAH